MTSPRRIDHLVLAVRDLDAAADTYRRLGFHVGARNRHPWGTENRLVQFRSSFLELIAVADAAAIPPHAPGRFSFGAFVRDFVARREGLAMLVLDCDDAVADAAAFARAGIGAFEPFHFERKGERPDGSETRVAFSLAFAVDPALPEAAFFVCQQHAPENFWNPAFQSHPNGAGNVAAVDLLVPDPAAHRGFLAAFCATDPAADGAFALRDGGALRVVAAPDGRGFAGFAVAVAAVAAQADRLRRDGVPFAATADGIATEAHGARVAFVPDARGTAPA